MIQLLALYGLSLLTEYLLVIGSIKHLKDIDHLRWLLAYTLMYLVKGVITGLTAYFTYHLSLLVFVLAIIISLIVGNMVANVIYHLMVVVPMTKQVLKDTNPLDVLDDIEKDKHND